MATDRRTGRVTIDEKYLRIDGQPTLIRSGEISYFRIPRREWRARLAAASEAGMNCTSTYIPWMWHEPEEGTFDFTGGTHPERDIRGYLDAIADSGMYAFVRPGPFINSELIYGGYPEWVFTKYPEVNSLRASGDVARWTGRGGAVPSILHPKHLELVERWYDQVIPLMAEYHIDRGGPLILTQPDNEFNLVFTYSLLESGYDPDVIGDSVAGTPGRWQQWLARNHGSLEAVRRRYGLTDSVTRIAEVDAPRRPPSTYGERALALDWLRFKQEYIFDYAVLLAGWMRDRGLTVPWTLNEPVNMVWDAGDHAAASKYLASHRDNCFSTGHLYLTSGEQDILGVPISLYRLELMKVGNFKGPRFASEMGAAWADLSRHRALYNWEILAHLALGHGLDGFNIYMFSGGVNPPHTNVYGRDYDWGAPIRSDGTRHQSYAMAKRFAEFAASWEQEILATEKVADVRIAIFSDLPLVGRFCESATVLKAADGAYGRAVVQPTPFGEVYDNIKGLFTVLTALNVNLELVSLTDPRRQPGDDVGPLIVPNPGALNPAGLQYLVDHLKSGGRALLYPTIPTATVEGEAWPDLADEIGLAPNAVTTLPAPMLEPGSSRWTIDTANLDEVAVDGRVRTFKVPQGAEVLATCGGKAVAFRTRAFAGEVVVAGILPTYLTFDSQRLFRELLFDGLRISRSVKSLDERLHVVARASGTHGPRLVTVANVLGEDSRTKLHVRRPGTTDLTFPQITELEIAPKRIYTLWTDLDLGGLTLRYCTSELRPLDSNRRTLELRGEIGCTGEVAFDRQVRLTFGDAQLNAVKIGDDWVATYRHESSTAVLRIEIASQDE